MFRVILYSQLNVFCLTVLQEIRRFFSFFSEQKSLYSFFRNLIPEIIFDFLREIGVFYKI